MQRGRVARHRRLRLNEDSAKNPVKEGLGQTPDGAVRGVMVPRLPSHSAGCWETRCNTDAYAHPAKTHS